MSGHMSGNGTPSVIIAGDIGGTNTNLALVRRTKEDFTILLALRFSTREESSLAKPIETLLFQAREKGIGDRPDICCISGAGPVRNGEIQLTNAPWDIKASEIEERFGLPAMLINDFTAISYAIPLLDPDNPSQILKIPHCDGSLPPTPKEGLALVVGAGTGLGVGFLLKQKEGRCLAFPSEGGHSELSCWDELSYAYHRWLSDQLSYAPGAELAVSGQGIASIFSFLSGPGFDTAMAEPYGIAFSPRPGEESSIDAAILRLPEQDRPAEIAGAIRKSPRCLLTMELFVRYYAAKVSGLASVFLPSGGIYLAGGISSKHETFLLDGQRFMRTFERNYSPHMRKYLAELPVMLVRDYSVSLLGAANAAVQLGSGANA
ncbi:Glucokinase [bioreactor metagenome]|jgi:glucokinase|uniref:Glucokinase n=2 Tax=root TaxID=1 RepID=A0A644TJV6_9ZZZZ|nr:putative Glucokinase [uncultured Spirochaetota bacterium]